MNLAQSIQKLKKYSLSLFAALLMSLVCINPIPAHAATNPEVEVEAIYSDDTYTPSANRKWYATYGTGTGYSSSESDMYHSSEGPAELGQGTVTGTM